MSFQINKYIFLLLLFGIGGAHIHGQSDSAELIKYSPDFKFKEGIYLNFEQVKKNSPLPKSRIISSINYNDPDFFDKILAQKSVYFYDNIGNKNELKTSRIWGYSRNGFVYIKMEDGFFRITLIGTVCHFVASETTYVNNYNNYNSYNSPYYYNSYGDPYNMHPSSYTTTEMRQYLLDFSTGRVLDYTEESLDVIFMADPKIHDEYARLSNKKRKQMKFYYMRKFNSSHPLYFPQN